MQTGPKKEEEEEEEEGKVSPKDRYWDRFSSYST
jgi:hypothetical protein